MQREVTYKCGYIQVWSYRWHQGTLPWCLSQLSSRPWLPAWPGDGPGPAGMEDMWGQAAGTPRWLTRLNQKNVIDVEGAGPGPASWAWHCGERALRRRVAGKQLVVDSGTVAVAE